MPAIARIAVWTLLLLALSLPCGALPPGEATQAIQGTIDKAREVLLDPRLRDGDHRSERSERLRKALSERFDWTRFARGVLGLHRRTLSAEQEKAFEALFRELLEATYLSRLDDVLEQVDEETLDAFRFVDEEIQGDRGVVKAEIDILKRGSVTMVYSVHRSGGEWMVYDVKVAGVSLVSNYRAQIDAILSRSDYDTLMKRLREKVAALNRGE